MSGLAKRCMIHALYGEKEEIIFMRKIISLLLLILATSMSLDAQGVAGLGAVSGTVRDATGAIIPGVTVVVSNDVKGIKRTLVTTEAGVFLAPALVPSSGYSLTVSLPGFKSWEARNFDIQVGQTV